MDNSTDKGDQKKSSDELDLSGLQNFNFATNWSESTTTVGRDRDRDRDRPARGGGQRRERQPDRRPPGSKKIRSSGSDQERGEPRAERTGRFERGRREERPQDLLRESPFEIQVFPEEPILATLTRAMRQSLRTYELFEIARLVLEKPDRFHVSFRYKEKPDGDKNLFQSVPDGLPFVSEEAAVDHVLFSHLETFFTVDEVEAEPPKGSFQFIARCTLTGDFLSPPNYHRYQPILLQYYQERFPNMSFEQFRSHIETVKDEEAIEKWLQSMTKQKRYTLRGGDEGSPTVFETLEEARAFLLQDRKDRLVRPIRAVRLPGKRVEEITDSAIKPYVLAYADQQRRFPLDTANTLRGRLRRQHFFIYKKGSRGISLVCAVKRKFRQPNQVFSESIQALIAFIEQNDQVIASQLPEKFLGITPVAEGEQHPPEIEAKLKGLNLDLRWLLSEGYVTELSDGRLSAHPVLPEARASQAGSANKEENREAQTGTKEETPAESSPTAEDQESPAAEATASPSEPPAEASSENEETPEVSSTGPASDNPEKR